MSLYASDDFGYLQQAEAYFLSHSKIGVMLSSKDTELLRRWREVGVPIEVVCYGVRRAFYEFKEPPRSVFQCRKLVEVELKAWKERLVSEEGAGQGALPLAWAPPGKELPDPTDPKRRGRLARLRGEAPAPVAPVPAPSEEIPEGELWLGTWYRSMWRLMSLGREAKGAAAREAYRWAYRRMNELRQEALVARNDVEILRRLGLAVGQVEAQMYERGYEALEVSAREALDAKLPANMGEALGKMSPQARERQLGIWRRRLLEDAQGIAPFFVP